MAGVGAQTFTFQLSTKTAEKTGGNVEQYRLQLTPSVNVPFTAQPRCQLEQLAFTNTVTNVDAALLGHILVPESHVASDSDSGLDVPRLAPELRLRYRRRVPPRGT